MPSLPVFYDPRQTASRNEGFSPSAGKPALVVSDWAKAGIPLEFRRFEPLSPEEISLAHDAGYVRGVLDCSAANGFGNRLPEVATTLPWTTGSMFAAAAHALKAGGFAASPTSGFHHASWYHGEGFCTFNGLMIAVLLLREKNLAERIGILDIDAHYGNGTEDIIRRLGAGDSTPHYSFGGDRNSRSGTREWLARLPDIVRGFKGCDVLLYQAGADPHVEDPLGGVLTTEELRVRDRVVFRVCADLGLPLAWNLAGGYQHPIGKVLAIHRNTALECVGAMEA